MSNADHSRGASHKKLTDFLHKPCPQCGCVCIDIRPDWSREDLLKAYNTARELQHVHNTLGAIYFLNALPKQTASQWFKSINDSEINAEGQVPKVQVKQRKGKGKRKRKSKRLGHLPGWEEVISDSQHLKHYLDNDSCLFMSVFYPHPGSPMQFEQGHAGDVYSTPLANYEEVMTTQTAYLRETTHSTTHCDTFATGGEDDEKTTGRMYQRGEKRCYTCAGGVIFDPKDMTVAAQEQHEIIKKNILGVIKKFSSERKSASNKPSKKEVEDKEEGVQLFIKCLKEGITQPLFKGVHSAPDLTADELKEAGLSCSHTLPAGSAYLIPQRCWHLVRNRTSNGRGSSAAWDCLYKANIPQRKRKRGKV
jgi:hypothetical protein